MKLWLKSPNPQVEYGSMSIPEQLLTKDVGQSMHQFLEIFLEELAIVHCKYGWKMTKLKKY